MRKLLFILFIASPFFTFGQTTYHHGDTQWDEDSKKMLLKSSNKPVTGSVKDGKHLDIYEDGVLISYKDYYKNGEIKQEKSYNGPWVLYYKNGQIELKGHLKEGKENGVFKRYNKKGILLEETNWKEGEELGVKYYDKKGILFDEYIWKSPTHTSYIYKLYNKGGNIQTEGNYIKGKKHGTWRYFIPLEDGSVKLEKKIVYQNGKKIKEF